MTTIVRSEIDADASDSLLRERLAAAEAAVEQLEQALHSSRTIGMAMGILMRAEHISEQEAFDLLVYASRHHRRKLRDVADEVVYTGHL